MLKFRPTSLCALCVVTALLAHAGQGPFQPNANYWLFLPFVANLYLPCPTTSSQTYDVIGIQGGYYKSNALTDENADFRLSILGYAPTTAPMTLVNYSGPADLHAPQMAGIFEPNRGPNITGVFKRYDWNWNESGPPPLRCARGCQ